MKEEPIISVIVPIYKVEQYLSRCVSSILSQTFADFELLLIDDGSPIVVEKFVTNGHLRIIVSEYFIRRTLESVLHETEGWITPPGSMWFL